MALTAERPTVRILGVDPGLNTTGYGVIEVAQGTVRLCEAETFAGTGARR